MKCPHMTCHQCDDAEIAALRALLAEATARAEGAEADAETERMRLVACGMAALDPSQLVGMVTEFDSASRQDVTRVVARLEDRAEKAEAACARKDSEIARLRAALAAGPAALDKFGDHDLHARSAKAHVEVAQQRAMEEE